MRGWTGLQRQEGRGFLQWLKKDQALRTGFDDLAGALRLLLRAWVRTEDAVCEVWAAVPAVMGQCDEPATYEKRGAARAYAWIHLLDRYVRTWLALQRLVEQAILPMGREGVRVLDVGTGPGPSAFALHDFFAAMVRYGEGTGNQQWRQPAQLTCVESAPEMDHFRHHLAERLVTQGVARTVLDMCSHVSDFETINPGKERQKTNERLRDAYEEYYDEDSAEWFSELSYTPEEANRAANSLHRYRLFSFSNFLTETDAVACFRQNLVDILSDARPGSVLLLVGGKGGDYPQIYREVAGLARETGFSREAESGTVACSDAGMDGLVHAEQAWFYRRLREIGGDLAVESDITKNLVREFEGVKASRFSASAVRAWRK